MIFDRTISDVRNAQEIRQSKLQKGVPLNVSDIEILEKGTVTVNTINRIESKQTELADVLKGMGYYAEIITKTWDKGDVFYESDFQRICDNNTAIRQAFFVYADSPEDAVPAFEYEELNALERILHDLERMIEFAKTAYRFCGTVECGG